ncbi:hypothetical protein K435DRAFT_660380 [Dendrothele bispora CBS 962.96]|uniref:Reverse transcriptase domain-containing protein n=1 Tax=Dendrothele bispora (strain CBS 962.96) TaxID=1314807 RepID=A0A4S8M8P5_DENBC|nr:hypothetical protein K435DRAFT_660380 [Dendrothele bispora CBS 962.96]
MRYKVRHGKSVSEEFQSLMGILAGDTLSPLLWILYFADFDIPQTEDDIELFGAFISHCQTFSHLEQADDLLLLGLSPAGLQRKMSLFYSWCRRNFMVINAIKSLIGFHGPKPRQTPTFHFGSELVSIASEYTYVGMTFQGGNFSSFSRVIAPHYNIKEKKAISVSHGILHLESMIGALPVDEGRIIYMGCVDPHLIYGCEVVLDTSLSAGKKFRDVQISFFRRLLGLSNSSVVAALFSETGIAPILFRRLELATRYLIYAIERPNDTYVYKAIRESAELHRKGSNSWFTDLLDVMEQTLPRSMLPLPSVVDLLNAEAAKGFHDKMKKSLPYWVEEQIGTAFRKTYLLQYRKEPNNEGTGYRHKAMCMRQYLGDIRNPKHRKAFTKLICGDHPLAVERLRWADNHRVSVPFEERLCRFCISAIENPEHALLECPHIPLASLQESYMTSYYSLHGNTLQCDARTDATAFLGNIISFKPAFSLTAKYIYEVLKIYDATPLHVPPVYRR